MRVRTSLITSDDDLCTPRVNPRNFPRELEQRMVIEIRIPRGGGVHQLSGSGIEVANPVANPIANEIGTVAGKERGRGSHPRVSKPSKGSARKGKLLTRASVFQSGRPGPQAMTMISILRKLLLRSDEGSNNRFLLPVFLRNPKWKSGSIIGRRLEHLLMLNLLTGPGLSGRRLRLCLRSLNDLVPHHQNVLLLSRLRHHQPPLSGQQVLPRVVVM